VFRGETFTEVGRWAATYNKGAELAQRKIMETAVAQGAASRGNKCSWHEVATGGTGPCGPHGGRERCKVKRPRVSKYNTVKPTPPPPHPGSAPKSAAADKVPGVGRGREEKGRHEKRNTGEGIQNALLFRKEKTLKMKNVVVENEKEESLRSAQALISLWTVERRFSLRGKKDCPGVVAATWTIVQKSYRFSSNYSL